MGTTCIHHCTPLNRKSTKSKKKGYFNKHTGNVTVYTMTTCRIVLYLSSGLGWRRRYSDLLRAGRSRDRIPVRARFSAPVQSGLGFPSSLLYNGYRISFVRVKPTGCGVNHPPPPSTEVKERITTLLLPLWALMACPRVNVTFYILLVAEGLMLYLP